MTEFDCYLNSLTRVLNDPSYGKCRVGTRTTQDGKHICVYDYRGHLWQVWVFDYQGKLVNFSVEEDET